MTVDPSATGPVAKTGRHASGRVPPPEPARTAGRDGAENRTPSDGSADNRATETRAAENRAAENRAAENRAAENRAAENRAAENRAAENRAADARPVAAQVPVGNPVPAPPGSAANPYPIPGPPAPPSWSRDQRAASASGAGAPGTPSAGHTPPSRALPPPPAQPPPITDGRTELHADDPSAPNGNARVSTIGPSAGGRPVTPAPRTLAPSTPALGRLPAPPALGRLPAPPARPRPHARPPTAPPAIPGTPNPGTPNPATPQVRPPAAPGSSTAAPATAASAAADVLSAPGRPATPTAAAPEAEPDGDLPVQLVHLSIETTQGDLDLCVPDNATPAALLSIVLAIAPQALRDQSVGRGGWLVSRRGGGPLPGGRTLSELGVVEGEVLRLSGASDAAPAPTFDDVADAVADAAGNQPHRWSFDVSRRAGEIFGSAFAVLGLSAVGLLGPPWGHVPLIAGALTAVLLVAAALVSRGIGQLAAAVPLGLAATVAAGISGATSIAGHRHVTQFVAPELAVGLGAVVFVGAVAVALVGRSAVSIMAVVVGAVLGAFAAVIGCIWTIPRVGEGALCVLVALLLTPVIATIAFRLARFELPPLPTNADDLAAINATVDHDTVATRTSAAIGYVTAMVVGSTAVGSLGMVLLSVSVHNTVAIVLVAAASFALLIRSRLFNSVGQRLPFLIAASIGLVSATVRVCLNVGGNGGPVWFIISMGVAMVVALGFAGRASLPKTPFYGRAAELIEILLAVSLIPLIATVMGLVGLMRGLGG